MQLRTGAFPRQHQKCTALDHKLPRRSERHQPSSIELASRKRKINSSQTFTVQQQTLRTPLVAQAMDDDYTGQSAQQQAEALRATAQTVLRGLDWADSQLTCSTLQTAASSAGMTTTSCKAHSIAAQQGPADARGQSCCAPVTHPLHIQAALHPASLKQGQHVGGVLDSTQSLQLVSQEQLEPGCAVGSRVTATRGLHSGSEQQYCATSGDRWRGAQHAAGPQEGQVRCRASSWVAESERAEGDDIHHRSFPGVPHNQVCITVKRCIHSKYQNKVVPQTTP